MNPDNRDQEERHTASKAHLIKKRYVDTRLLHNVEPLTNVISVEEMQKLGIVPMTHSAYQVDFGFTEKTNKSSLDKIRQRFTQYNIDFALISESSYREILNAYFGLAHKVNPDAYKSLELQQQIAQAQQQELFLRIIQQAYDQGASDIHIEPTKDEVVVRLRIDGVLHRVAKLPLERYEILLSELQTKAGIKWNVDYPQTGRVSAEVEGKGKKIISVNMRVETIPTLHGSDIVIRIFNLEVEYLNLDHLGLSAKQKQTVLDLITHPHGMVLMVGPTGSGKTSTQYAIVNRLNKSEVKIVTLEDPIEYELEGVAQIPVRTIDQESFIEKFRAVLREDPDIIMLGEIRDPDTAKTALQAPLTGHLVLSTFHAASAAAAVSRLMDMIGQNPLLASAIRLIMAQRLVRKLCESCKLAYHPSVGELEKLKKILSTLPESDRPNLEGIQLYRAKGCDKCNTIGYKGRIMIAEQLKMSSKMEQFIAHGTAETTTEKIQELAIAEGMITLLQDALLEVVNGVTSLQEVYRVIEV